MYAFREKERERETDRDRERRQEREKKSEKERDKRARNLCCHDAPRRRVGVRGPRQGSRFGVRYDWLDVRQVRC